MNFFKKVLPVSQPKELIKTFQNYKIYKSKYNHNPCTIFSYTNYKTGIIAIQILKTIKHPNIMIILKTKEEKNNTYIKTELLFFLCDFYHDSISYIHYVLCTLSELIIFMKRCNIAHNNLTLDSFFINSTGKFILCGFEESYKGGNQNDEYMFQMFIEKIRKDLQSDVFKKKNQHNLKFRTQHQGPKNENDIGHEKTLDFNIKDYTRIEDLEDEILNGKYFDSNDFLEKNRDFYEKNIYKRLEKILLRFKLLSDTEKMGFLNFIIANRNDWIEIVKENIITVFIDELQSQNDTYKEKILMMIFELNLKNYNQYIEKLFSILDSQVRLFLLQNIDIYMDKVSIWDNKICENLLLGIKCNDQTLKIESSKFLDKIADKLHDKNIKEIIKTFVGYLKNEESMKIGLGFIRNNGNRIKNDQNIANEAYKLLIAYLTNNSLRQDVLEIIKINYKYFEVSKIQKELLPLLCNYLSDQQTQDLCFDMIELLIKHLKENKENIINKEWGVKKLSKMLSRVSMKLPGIKKDKEDKKSKKESKDENDWDEEW